MEVNSKFRTLFLVRKNIIFFLLVGLCFWMLFEGIHESVSGIISTSIILFGICAIFQLINLRSVYKIIVSDKGIIKIYFVTNEQEFIPFSSIANIHMERVEGMYSDAGQITTGYYESLIILRNNKRLIITPDHFENYHELINAIKYNWKNPTKL